MFDHKYVCVSLLKHQCLKVKHVSGTLVKAEGPAGWQMGLHPDRICVLSVENPETEITCQLATTLRFPGTRFAPITILNCIIVMVITRTRDIRLESRLD